jgi:hypothetical protein
MRTFLVSWSGKIEAESAPEASVKALAAMKDPDEWQFNASIEDITEEDEEYTITNDDWQTFCNDLCGNDSPCAVDQCEDFKNRFKKD